MGESYGICCKWSCTNRSLRCSQVVFNEIRSELSILNAMKDDTNYIKGTETCRISSISRKSRWQRNHQEQTQIAKTCGNSKSPGLASGITRNPQASARAMRNVCDVLNGLKSPGLVSHPTASAKANAVAPTLAAAVGGNAEATSGPGGHLHARRRGGTARRQGLLSCRSPPGRQGLLSCRRWRTDPACGQVGR